MPDDYVAPPPTSEQEEQKRRASIKLADIVAWYKRQRKPLDVPLTDYVPRSERVSDE